MLTRRTALQRGTVPLRRTPFLAKPRKRDYGRGTPWKQAKAETWERDNGVCQWHLESAYVIRSQVAAVDIHHVRSVGAGGDNAPENLVSLCRGCHGLAHDSHIRRQDLERLLAQKYGYDYGN